MKCIVMDLFYQNDTFIILKSNKNDTKKQRGRIKPFSSCMYTKVKDINCEENQNSNLEP